MTNLLQVDWSELPPPHDDGGARHLDGAAVPSLSLLDTRGNAVDLSRLAGTAVVYAYPMTGRPDMSLPDGWDMIPGARGCTPQSCAFRDHYVIAVGTRITARPPHRSVRAEFPHTAPTLGV